GELLQRVWDDSESKRVDEILTKAHKIANGVSTTIGDQAYKGAAGAVQYALQNLNAGQTGPVELEPGESELFSGFAKASTFKFIGTSVSQIKSKPITWLWPERIS